MTDKHDPPRPDVDLAPRPAPGTSTLDAKLGEAIERYGNSPVARALLITIATVLGAAPSVGPYAVLLGIFDFVTSNRAQEIAAGRTQRLIESLAREATGTREDMIRADYFQSEAWHDLFRRAVEANAKVSDNARRDAIARILVGAATGNVHAAAEPESLMAVLAEMSENEAVVLRTLWNSFGRNGEHQQMDMAYQWSRLEVSASVVEQRMFLLQRLIGRGLLLEHTSTKHAGRDNEVTGLKQKIGFTPTGAALMGYLEANPPAPPTA